MGCHGNHAISHKQNRFIFDNNFLHNSGLSEQNGMYKKLIKEFNVDLIIPLDLVYPMISFLKVSLIFMNMQMRYFSYRTTG